MNGNTFKTRLLASSVFAGVAFGVVGGLAVAQETDDEARQETIYVTGSILPQKNLTETSPVTQINADEFTLRGTTRTEDLINTLPQAFAAQGASYANGASGTAQVNLRGLGAERTLVLIDGKRMPYGSPIDTPADLNQIPAALVERVEVLTGGASAVYGSDALAGVVNFIMQDDFEGVRLDTSFHLYQHDNNNSEIQDVLNRTTSFDAVPFDFPDGNVTDGRGADITLIMGANTGDGKGNVTGYAGYSRQSPVYQGDRDYGACALSGPIGNFSCSGSSAAATANVFDAAAGFGIVNLRNGGVTPDAAGPQRFNFNPYNHYLRPSERYTAGLFAHYEVSPHFEPYLNVQFMDYTTDAQIAPSGTFNNTDLISCDNPLLSDVQRDYFCVQTAAFVEQRDLNGDGILEDVRTGAYINRRNVEGGARSDHIEHISTRMIAGARGELFEGFSYDVFGLYGNVDRLEYYQNDLNPERLQNALLVDANGNCYIDTDNCVPYNAFSTGPVDPASLQYMYQDLQAQSDTSLKSVGGNVTGDLGVFGIKSPGANDGIGIGVGFEYRDYELDVRPDEAYQIPLGTGQGGPFDPVKGNFDVMDLFTEVQVPLIQDMEFAQDVTLRGAYRFSDYSTGVTADTYMIGLDWRPVEDIRFRGSFQKATRAANILELFSPQSIGLFDLPEGTNNLYDPCSGATPLATFDQCSRQGVTAAQYGSIPDNPAGQFNFLGGGNPNLDPEEGETTTFGVVFTPTFLPGFNATVDYFDIEITNAISSLGAAFIVDACTNAGNYCDLINRDPGSGALWLGSGNVVSTLQNVASFGTKGIDFTAGYSYELPGTYGDLSFDYVGTLLDELTYQPAAGEDIIDCVGFHNSTCGTPNPEYRHKLRAGWLTPYSFDLTATWRYYGEVEAYPNGGSEFDAQNYFDLGGRYYLGEKITISGGVNNVFDEEPPIASGLPTGAGNGNTYPQVYDALGRYVFLGATIDF